MSYAVAAASSVSHRLEGVSSILLSPGSASKLRKSRLAAGSPPPPPALDSTAATSCPGSCEASPTAVIAAVQAPTAAEHSLACCAGSSASSSPTKENENSRHRHAWQQDPSAGPSSSAAEQLPAVVAAKHLHGNSLVAEMSVDRAESGNSYQGKFSLLSQTAPFTSKGSRLLSSLGVGSNSSSIFKTSGTHPKQHAANLTSSTAADGSKLFGDSQGGLFCGLRVRMGVVTGSLHWEHCTASGGGGSGNAAPAIINSSLYKLAVGEFVSL